MSTIPTAAHLISLLVIAACSSPGAAPDAPLAEPAGATTVAATTAASAAADSLDLPGAVRTETITPRPITIRVADLPEPYATQSASKRPDVIDVPADPVLRVPAGFAVQVWADNLESPRWLALAPDGAVLLVESRENRIKRLRDTDGDGVADQTETVATRRNGLDLPMGVAFADGDLFVGNTSEVVRFAYDQAQPLQGEGTRVADLPGRGYNQHWTRNVVASPDGDSLYVTVGSESNVDPEPLPRASVFRIAPDGSGRKTVSFGLRNPVGLAFNPVTATPYVTVNERRPPGRRARAGLPHPDRRRALFWLALRLPRAREPRPAPDGRPAERAPELAARTTTPDVLFEAHSAALGLQFYPTGASTPGAAASFPARYRGGAFVAMRGSWNKSRGAGYKVVHVPFENGRPTGAYEDFLTGFLVDPSGPKTFGRPVGLLVLPDGSLLVTEESNGRIYRVSYTG